MTTQSFVVCRDFRGALLFLVSVRRDSLAFDWSADGAKARRFENHAGALAAARLARDEYNASCAVRDAAHCLLVPAASALGQPHKFDSRGRPLDNEPRGVATRGEFRRIVTAQQSEHGPHCAEHSGYTDGCAGCYAAHLKRSH